ncbi:MAG: thiolase domain-containing protein [Candidatus Pacebacteria bacterium]|nr:thiolase domain-containing protein [Candidatus Paceibacterota bacterium]
MMPENKKIHIVGSHITQFGELWDRSLEDLAYEATTQCITDADLQPKEIDAIFVANMTASQFETQAHLGALVSDFLPHHPPSTRVEAACASGGVAIVQACQALLSGLYETVLVVGVEKMTDGSADAATVLSAAAHQSAEYGSTFPGLYALLAQAHMQKYKTPRSALSMIAAKNHGHGISNKKAQFRRAITPEAVEKTMMVSEPLRVLDCSPISDGAAAVILSTTRSKMNNSIQIIGFGQGQDSLQLSKRKSLTSLQSTKDAAQNAYRMANQGPESIDVAEVHDCFSIAELLAMEDLGFCEPGKAAAAVLKEKTSVAKNSVAFPVINHSGGLKACGHPVGATGVKQVAYLYELLSSSTNYSTGLTHNVGGSGATAVVTIVQKVNSTKGTQQ